MNAAEIFRSSSSRPLPLRARTDLQTRREIFAGSARFVVRQPLSGVYSTLAEREYFLLTLLDGNTSLDALKNKFEERYPDHETTIEDLHHFVLHLHKQGLLESLSAGEGARLLARQRDSRWKRVRTALLNPLCVKLPGVSPARLLRLLMPLVGWSFTPAPALMLLFSALFTLSWSLLHASDVAARMPDWRDLTQPSRLFSWLFLLAGLKCMHELGHAIACERMGARCRAIGVMFLLFSPCLYCNVTDAWSISSKWKRAAVSLGGIYVETGVAVVAAWLWWWSRPGFFNDMCLQTAISGSLTTILFNANPLMKYDGYYVLCDLWETPDLSERARSTFFSALMHALGLGDPNQDGWRSEPQFGRLAIYGASATVYRLVMMFSITYVMLGWARQFQLTALAIPVFIAAWCAALAQPAYAMIKQSSAPVPWSELKAKRGRLLRGAAWCFLALGALFIPLPTSIECEVEVRPANAAAVYIQTSGRLTRVFRKPGDQVRQGELLALLEDHELELSVADAKRRLNAARLQLAARVRAKGQRSHDEGTAEDEERVRRLEIWVSTLEQDFAKLRVTAPQDGVLLAPHKKHLKETHELELVGWDGLAHEGNIGCQLSAGELWGLIRSGNKSYVRLDVPESEGDLLSNGQSVRIQLDGSSWQAHTAAITGIRHASESLPSAQQGTGRSAAVEKKLEASAEWRNSDVEMLPYSRGRGRIQVGWHSWYWRITRFLNQTFQHLT